MSDYESYLLEDISLLHTEMYNKMSSISGVTGLVFLGFDSSRTNPELPKIGMKISLTGMEIDRRRPTPSETNRLEIETGTPVDYTVEGVLYEDIYPEREYKYPLPLNLEYSINTWCYSATTQLQLDLKLLQTFPERGVLRLEIDSETYEFPITLKAVKNLDDLAQNLREKVYIYNVECYVSSWIEERTGKIITSIIEQIAEGTPDDYVLVDEFNFTVDP